MQHCARQTGDREQLAWCAEGKRITAFYRNRHNHASTDVKNLFAVPAPYGSSAPGSDLPAWVETVKRRDIEPAALVFAFV